MKPLKSVKSDVESALPRDQWDRPLIVRPDGTTQAYRRASSVAEAIEDHYGLNVWKRRLTAEGLAARPDLIGELHGASKTEVERICEEAFDYAGGNTARRNGSTMHRLTDWLDTGRPLPKRLPENVRAMLDAYKDTTARLRVLDTEQFTVADAIAACGTYDRRVWDEETDRTLIGDLKTGQHLDLMAVKTCAQVAVYAAGEHYDLDHERSPHGAERDWGLFIWLPWVEEAHEAECELRWLDLKNVGRPAIKEAFRVEKFRKINARQAMPRVT